MCFVRGEPLSPLSFADGGGRSLRFERRESLKADGGYEQRREHIEPMNNKLCVFKRMFTIKVCFLKGNTK